MQKQKPRELLFSVTREDCNWDYFRCSGPGGQKVNKTNSGVRCTHRASGAIGKATDERSQKQNRVLAFTRMAESKAFKIWHRMEVARRTGAQSELEQRVRESMKQIKVEIKQDNKWTEVDKNDPLKEE